MSVQTPKPESHDPWCVIAQIVHDRLVTMRLPESLIDVAEQIGWHVVICDSEMLSDIEPNQRNPNRSGDE